MGGEVAGMKKGYLDIEKLTNEGWMLFRNIHTQNSIASEMRKLEYFAAPDVVEVVRCKDCKWYVESKAICKFHSNNYEPPVYCTEVDYCSYGVSKEDEA